MSVSDDVSFSEVDWILGSSPGTSPAGRPRVMGEGGVMLLSLLVSGTDGGDRLRAA